MANFPWMQRARNSETACWRQRQRRWLVERTEVRGQTSENRHQGSDNFFPCRNLIGGQKSFHQIAFPADDHPGKAPEPFLIRHFGLGVEPVGKQSGFNAFESSLPGFPRHTQSLCASRRKAVSRDTRAVSARVDRQKSHTHELDQSNEATTPAEDFAAGS